MLMESFTKRIDVLTKDLFDFQASLHFTQGDVDTLKITSENLTKDCNNLVSDINMLNSKHNMTNGKIDYLENQSCCTNSIFDGILESVQEKWSDSEENIRKTLQEKTQA